MGKITQEDKLRYKRMHKIFKCIELLTVKFWKFRMLSNSKVGP